MGNVKARGVGEITFSMGGVLGSGSATATSRARRVSKRSCRERTMVDSQCTRESRVRMAGMMMIIGTRGDN